MFRRRKKSKTLRITDLVKIVREAHLSNAGIEEYNGYGYDDIKTFKIRFEKFYIIDTVQIRGSSKNDEEHNIEINLIDGKTEITVYKSPEFFVHIGSSGEIKVEIHEWISDTNRKQMKNEKVEWIHEGEWCTYIINEINALGLEIESVKLQRRMLERKEENAKVEEQNKILNHFNELFTRNK